MTIRGVLSTIANRIKAIFTRESNTHQPLKPSSIGEKAEVHRRNDELKPFVENPYLYFKTETGGIIK
jgi:hypothetical protein